MTTDFTDLYDGMTSLKLEENKFLRQFSPLSIPDSLIRETKLQYSKSAYHLQEEWGIKTKLILSF